MRCHGLDTAPGRKPRSHQVLGIVAKSLRASRQRRCRSAADRAPPAFDGLPRLAWPSEALACSLVGVTIIPDAFSVTEGFSVTAGDGVHRCTKPTRLRFFPQRGQGSGSMAKPVAKPWLVTKRRRQSVSESRRHQYPNQRSGDDCTAAMAMIRSGRGVVLPVDQR